MKKKSLKNRNKRDLKASTKKSTNCSLEEQNKEYTEKIKKRKIQNRLAAQKSRDRKKLKMETLERENETLKQEIKRVKDILSSYSNQL